MNKYTVRPRTPEEMAANPGRGIESIEIEAPNHVFLWIGTVQVWRGLCKFAGYKAAAAAIAKSVWSGQISVTMEGRMRFWRSWCIGFMALTLLRDCNR